MTKTSTGTGPSGTGDAGAGGAESPLAMIWSALGGDPGLLDRVQITGPEHLLPAAFDVAGLATVSVCAATLAVAEFGARRRGTPVAQVGVDRFAAAAAFRSEALLRSHGWERPPLWDPIGGDYRTADGWIKLHTNYAHHRTAALHALGFAADADTDGGPRREEVADRVRGFGADELERAVVAAGGCAAALHTAQEWQAHPHGAFAVGQPAIAFGRRPASGGRTSPNPPASVAGEDDDGPLAGIRVLDLTRVIAGPVCTRTLAAWGADVLRIDPPGFAEVPALLADMTVGKHCAALDLRNEEARARFGALVAEADVIVHGLRPGALAGLGYPNDVLWQLNPDLCIAALDAYGWAGPWAGRRGFDSLVQVSTGIAAAGAAAVGSDRPVSLPAQALDHATGYLLAAAVCRGLTDQDKGFGPAELRGALVGTANLLTGHFATPPEPTEPADSAGRTSDLVAATVRRDTDWGPVSAVTQPGTIDGRTGVWRVPAGPLGRHQPSFAARTGDASSSASNSASAG
jgi:hypothetical protein